MATVVNGTNFLVYIAGEAIVGAKSCKITLTHDGRDTFTKDDSGWKTMAEGARSWSVSADGLVAFDGSGFEPDELTNLMINRTRVQLKFQTGTSSYTFWYGMGYVKSVDVDAGNEESVGFSASFDGDGVLTQATHT